MQTIVVSHLQNIDHCLYVLCTYFFKVFQKKKKKIKIFCYHLNITKFRFNNYQETSKKTQRNTHLISSCSYNRLHDQLFKNNKTVNKRSFIEIYKYHIIVKCDWQPNKMLKWYSELKSHKNKKINNNNKLGTTTEIR